MAFKYAFNTWVYGSFPVWVPAYTLDETIRRLARIGYDGIEIGCAHVPPRVTKEGSSVFSLIRSHV